MTSPRKPTEKTCKSYSGDAGEEETPTTIVTSADQVAITSFTSQDNNALATPTGPSFDNHTVSNVRLELLPIQGAKGRGNI